MKDFRLVKSEWLNETFGVKYYTLIKMSLNLLNLHALQFY